MATDPEKQCRRILGLTTRQGGMVMLTHDPLLGEVFTLVKGAMAGEIVGPSSVIRRLIAGRYLEPQDDGLLPETPQTWKVAN